MEDIVVVRYYDEERDLQAVEAMEKLCEFGSSSSDGDLKNKKKKKRKIAEYGEKKEIVGTVRGCMKTVTRGKTIFREFPVYVKVAYLLGLRVSPSHRRLGIGTCLVRKMEEWCVQNGAEYVYMATDRANSASLALFTQKHSFVHFRSPTVLVRPVHPHHDVPTHPRRCRIIKLSPSLAEAVYLRAFSSAEFFPKDISAILSNPLSLGTFLAVPAECDWDPTQPDPHDLPPRHAVVSVWNTKDSFRLQVRGAPRLWTAACRLTRAVDACAPWMRVPSVPDVFETAFGVYFMYGLHARGEGGAAEELMRSLCGFVHNMARADEGGCKAVVAEVGRGDPVLPGVPYWRRFSFGEDVWCMKKVGGGEEDWIESQPSTPVVFVDPRDF
ncbi:hypothetical protein QJS10_CPA05g02207 [Acorus calamus]|uniref:N-acetyltransferase domain-containing protein n=1 Tax=Acorus calamus TaxID=4465 RepID=A0AAV9EV50_ACOCL|nr:hypothetical protein QJS10_CPA05g02207 [Acorus calamus]